MLMEMGLFVKHHAAVKGQCWISSSLPLSRQAPALQLSSPDLKSRCLSKDYLPYLSLYHSSSCVSK